MFRMKLLESIGRKVFPSPGLMCTQHSAINKSASIARDEIESASEIETNLYDNSSKMYNPTNVATVLRATKAKHFGNHQQGISIKKKPESLKKSIIYQQPNKPQLRELELINDPELGLTFARLQSNDKVLTNLFTFIRSRKQRDKNRKIIVEGRRLILEALNCGLLMHSLFFSVREEISLIKDNVSTAQKKNGTKIYKIAHHDLKTWSTLTTPPGLLAIFERPDSRLISCSTQWDLLPITVVCDNIREPNNLGSIIRTCAAVPCYQVIVTKGCCDPWDSKALRGGCGGQFRTNIHDDIKWDDIPQYIPEEFANDYALFIAENNVSKVGDLFGKDILNEKCISYSNITQIKNHNVVIIGGETCGVSSEAYKFFESVQEKGTFLHIPLAEGIESLNVNSALTLILFELRKLAINPKTLATTLEK